MKSWQILKFFFASFESFLRWSRVICHSLIYDSWEWRQQNFAFVFGKRARISTVQFEQFNSNKLKLFGIAGLVWRLAILGRLGHAELGQSGPQNGHASPLIHMSLSSGEQRVNSSPTAPAFGIISSSCLIPREFDQNSFLKGCNRNPTNSLSIETWCISLSKNDIYKTRKCELQQ